MHLLTLLNKSRPVVYDGFNRPNNTTLGKADTGHTWEKAGGDVHMGVTGGAASSPSNVFAVSFVDSGRSDCVISVKLAVYEQFARVYFRLKDDRQNTFILVCYVSGYEFYRTQNNVNTKIGANGQVPQTGDYIQIVLSGSNIKLLVNGVQLISATDSFNQFETRHGISVDKSTIRLDDFKVEELP